MSDKDKCEYCHKDENGNYKNIMDNKYNNKGDYLKIVDNEWNLEIELCYDDSDYGDSCRNTEVKIKYCPMCGRDLREV